MLYRKGTVREVMDLLTKAIQTVDLPALVLEIFPDSGAVPNKSGKILAVWRGEKNESASLFLKDNVGPWLLKDHATGECVNAFSFLIQMADYNKQSAAEKLISFAGLDGEKPQKKEIVATYEYTDEDGGFLFETVRFKPKSFAQRTKKDGQWVWKLGSTRRVLFRLPEVKRAIAENIWLALVEGEEDVLTLEKHGIVATTCPMGAGKWRGEYTESLAGAILVIFPDNDKVGIEHALKVAREVYGTVREVKIVGLSGLKDKEDITDWFNHGHTVEELRQIVENTNPFEISEVQRTDEEVIKSKKPVIQVNNRFLRDIASDAIKALHLSNDPPRLYIRSKLLSRVDRDGKAQIMDNASLKGHLDRCADFVTIRTQNEQKNVLPARPPSDLALDLLSLETYELGLPELETISNVPILTSQGRILTKDGYDAESKTLLILDDLKNFTFVFMSIAEAIKIIDDIITDFPFAFPNIGRAHVYAMLLQHFVRQMINGATPLHLIESPTRGTGKGKLCNVVSLVITGKHAPIMTLPRTGEEMEKRITSNLLEGHPLILLDNVNTLGGDELAAVLTARIWRGRRLGKSEMLHVANNTLWVATGNNVDLRDDIPRRVVPIRLDAGVEKPEERKEFKHSDLEDYILQNRSKIISACLSLIQHWITNGCPKGSRSLGSYESYAQIIGGILETAGVEGFLDGREYLYEHSDKETTEWKAVCEIWWRHYESRPISSKDLFELCKENHLLLDIWGGRSDKSGLTRLGIKLSKNRDRVFGNFVINFFGKDGSARVTTYKLSEISPDS